MAGAGYKLFNTGDVLTAAQVNTYLQEQTVMVFADATARTTALSGVLAEGMVTYLKDTDAVEKYDGSAWVSIGGGASPLTTKGDLYTYSTADARLAVGNNGETLVADSSATTGLRWQGNYAAGKNKIINGDFNINQRGFSSTTTTNTYGFDRFNMLNSGGTVTYSAQTFTAGAAPVAGYEGTNFARLVTASQSGNGDYALLQQKIENVRTLANQIVTLSFWAKASTGTPNIGICLEQQFGSGGSSTVIVGSQVTAITSSWARYSFNITIPSISGKTIGTNNFLNAMVFTSAGTTISGSGYPAVGLQNVTIDTWGWQLEAGSVATAFQTATGTLAGELAACQRYYFKDGKTAVVNGYAQNATNVYGTYVHPTTMRTSPTLTQSGAVNFSQNTSATTFTLDSNGSNEIRSLLYFLAGASNALTYIYRTVEWSAEL